MIYPPPIETVLTDLPNDPKDRHEVLVDIFGKYLLWAMNEALSRSNEMVESAEARELCRRSHAAARIAMQTQEAEFAARLAAIENERKVIDQQMLQLADSIKGTESSTKGSCRRKEII